MPKKDVMIKTYKTKNYALTEAAVLSNINIPVKE